MMTLAHAKVCSATILAFGLTFALASAQTPQQTTATYGDWMLLCVTPNGKKSCVIVQSQIVQGQTSPIGQVTISRPTKNDSLKVFFQVPTNVWLQGGISLTTDEPTHASLVGTFRWCVSARCLADADLTDSIVKNLRAQKKVGRITYKTASQADASFSVSFTGFNEALDALQKE
jgi:invasion protein IalB